MAHDRGQLSLLPIPRLVDNLAIVAVRRLRPLIDEETCITVLLDLGATLEECRGLKRESSWRPGV
jgi:hypothetical protein